MVFATGSFYSVCCPSYKYCPKMESLAESGHDGQDVVIVVGSLFSMTVKSRDIKISRVCLSTTAWAYFKVADQNSLLSLLMLQVRDSVGVVGPDLTTKRSLGSLTFSRYTSGNYRMEMLKATNWMPWK
jgi:hypothetical protein